MFMGREPGHLSEDWKRELGGRGRTGLRGPPPGVVFFFCVLFCLFLLLFCGIYFIVWVLGFFCFFVIVLCFLLFLILWLDSSRFLRRLHEFALKMLIMDDFWGRVFIYFIILIGSQINKSIIER